MKTKGEPHQVFPIWSFSTFFVVVPSNFCLELDHPRGLSGLVSGKTNEDKSPLQYTNRPIVYLTEEHMSVFYLISCCSKGDTQVAMASANGMQNKPGYGNSSFWMSPLNCRLGIGKW